AAGGVDLLDGDLVARAHLSAAGTVAAGQRNHGADLDGFGRRERGPHAKHKQREHRFSCHRALPRRSGRGAINAWRTAAPGMRVASWRTPWAIRALACR